MASAAAVGADTAETPLQDVNDELGTSGFVGPVDPTVPNVNSDDEDEDDVAPRHRRKTANAAVEGGDHSPASEKADADLDLFGGASDDENATKQRRLDDSDLDSGDDEGAQDRRPEEDVDVPAPQETEEVSMLSAQIASQSIPEATDGEFYLLKVPSFFGIEPTEFKSDTFKPPTKDHHAKEHQGPSETFSAHHTAIRTVRWRRSPSDSKLLQSNARVLRWSDGSLTLQFASNPSAQYPMPAHGLAPPQSNPKKPTPISRASNKKSKKGNRDTDYRLEDDSFTYFATVNLDPDLLRITNKVTVGLTVDQAADASEDAVAKLQARMAAASRGANTSAEGGGIGMINVTEDPELAKKQAEMAEKDKMKTARKREAQDQRQKERTGRVLGSRGLHTAGLTAGALEDEDDFGGGAGSGRLPSVRKPRAKRRRTGEIYSDEEEDYGRRGRTREDEYDQEDDFLAASDEEEEVAEESEEDIDEGIDAGADEAQIPPEGVAGKPSRKESNGDAAEQRPSKAPPTGSPLARSKRRRVIEEDDEDE
ncbi:MAG: hypothetical protein M1828_001505 [Chrysothrix sp. TS-e1954]|nr:MAG: hypothetical protein M1828_001505 [Chrysothrix sp. TS-e1954]